ncbi:hypothetical protein Vid5_gp43 [Pantoea phage vB_PagS_Vid5]|uniref:Uncharacterized protein n=1 Tax=Pantoea phage vB_PagS_Vid5 TaxID=2099652 RepID=A0A2P1CKT9_9CAUD|nr:hypothetical protein FDJ45_gp043 [Pantoea phage vB_PagS_Vid5]AVJ51798.1 hypothetical protein Vid5_gp43 [Pantoea phage vB_PagS_Vid5]
MQHILIDMDGMKVIAKHPNFAVLSELGVIMCSESQVVMPLEAYALENLTDLEFQLLYINLTGNKMGVLYDSAAAQKVVLDYLNEIPETELSPYEVGKQCDWCLENDLQGRCTYVPGSNVPSQEQTLWDGFKIPAKPERESAIVSGEVTTDFAPPVQPAFEAVEETAVTRRTDTGQPAAPRTGSVRDTIWTKADELWLAAGSPMDKSAVLKVRREVMNVLEAEGIKKTSSSNELGKWQLNKGIV